MTYYYPTPIHTEQPVITPPQLGQWCLVWGIAEKVHNNDSTTCTQWQRRQVDERKMMFIGVRKVREGRMQEVTSWDEYEGTRYKSIFQPTRFIDVWLMVEDMHKKPVHCLPGDVSVIPF